MKKAVLNFTEDLPFQLEEHRNIREVREYLTQQANEYAELVDIGTYGVSHVPMRSRSRSSI